MFWSIFLQSFFLILAIVVIGRIIAGLLDKRENNNNSKDG